MAGCKSLALKRGKEERREKKKKKGGKNWDQSRFFFFFVQDYAHVFSYARWSFFEFIIIVIHY